MPKEWSFSAHIDAAPGDVYHWLSDHQHDDHANERFQRGSGAQGEGKRNVRTVTRKDERHARVHDEWGRQTFEVDVELSPETHEVRLSGPWGYQAVWGAKPDGKGTLVTVHGRLAPKGMMALVTPLFAGSMVKQMRADFDGHMMDLRETLAK